MVVGPEPLQEVKDAIKKHIEDGRAMGAETLGDLQ